MGLYILREIILYVEILVWDNGYLWECVYILREVGGGGVLIFEEYLLLDEVK